MGDRTVISSYPPGQDGWGCRRIFAPASKVAIVSHKRPVAKSHKRPRGAMAAPFLVLHVRHEDVHQQVLVFES